MFFCHITFLTLSKVKFSFGTDIYAVESLTFHLDCLDNDSRISHSVVEAGE